MGGGGGQSRHFAEDTGSDDASFVRPRGGLSKMGRTFTSEETGKLSAGKRAPAKKASSACTPKHQLIKGSPASHGAEFLGVAPTRRLRVKSEATAHTATSKDSGASSLVIDVTPSAAMRSSASSKLVNDGEVTAEKVMWGMNAGVQLAGVRALVRHPRPQASTKRCMRRPVGTALFLGGVHVCLARPSHG